MTTYTHPPDAGRADRRRLLVVEKSLVNPKALFVPFSAFANIDQGDLTINLSLPREVIVKEHGMLPANA